MALLEVKNISKSFDGNLIIKDTSFAVNPGDTIAFTSPSGSGKSTLLSIAGLLLKPDGGTILTEDGQNVLEYDDKKLSRLRQELFGFVFQTTQLVGSLRAIENVTSPTSFVDYKLPFHPEERATELLENLGLADRLYHYPHQLSVGQRRRVAVARALMLQPKIIIADEPTNDLDAESAADVTKALFDYAAEGHALLFATHIPELSKRASKTMTLQSKVFK